IYKEEKRRRKELERQIEEINEASFQNISRLQEVPVDNTGLNNQEALVNNIENLDEVQVNYTESLVNSDEDELNYFKLPSEDEYDFLNCSDEFD
ncbi:8281_t:CDS:2, partial [Racocetra fulgida]